MDKKKYRQNFTKEITMNINNYHKSIVIILLFSFLALAATYSRSKYEGSSIAIVTLIGAHIKAKDAPIVSKYNRKDCPVCRGTGKYISGDGIKEVDCGYCE
jgi:hypothetical protein